MPKTYLNHYLPMMVGEFKRAKDEFESKRTLDDPKGKAFIVVKQLDTPEKQIALIYMCDDMNERLIEAEEKIKRLEDQVIKLMVTLNKYDQGNNHDGALQSTGDDRGADQG